MEGLCDEYNFVNTRVVIKQVINFVNVIQYIWQHSADPPTWAAQVFPGLRCHIRDRRACYSWPRRASYPWPRETSYPGPGGVTYPGPGRTR